MFKLVTGKQRQGKTAYLVDLIRKILENTDRKVLTDISIDRNEMCRVIGKNIGSRLKILTKTERLRFLDHKEGTHTDIFIDEAYQLFPSFAVSGLLSNEEKAQYQAYIMEHNKFHDNIFFICHDASMLHSSVRLGVEAYIRVRHSYTVSIFNWYLLKGLTYPKKFFIIDEFWDRKEFESKAGMPDIPTKLIPYKNLFKIYKTNKVSNGLTVGTNKKITGFYVVQGAVLEDQEFPLKMPIYEEPKKEYAYSSWLPFFANYLKSKCVLWFLIIFTMIFIYSLGSRFYGFVTNAKSSKPKVSKKEKMIVEEIKALEQAGTVEDSVLFADEATRKPIVQELEPEPVKVGRFLYRSNNLFVFENLKIDLVNYKIKYYRGKFWIEEKYFSYSSFALFSVDFVESMKLKNEPLKM